MNELSFVFLVGAFGSRHRVTGLDARTQRRCSLAAWLSVTRPPQLQRRRMTSSHKESPSASPVAGEVIAPGAFAAYFRELGALLASAAGAPPPPAALGALAARYGLEFDFAAMGWLLGQYGLRLS